MKKDPQTIKPGHLDGQRGDRIERFSFKGGVWHQHMKDFKDDKGDVIRSRIVGTELVSGMEHWWLDEGIKRPRPQQGDWDFRTPLDGDSGPLVPLDYKIKVQHGRQPHAWQLPWAWDYECWREWQPWSDFDRWRRDWRKEVKRLLDPSTPNFCGKRTREEVESDAAFTYGGRLRLWLLRDFAEWFPNKPWVKIPAEMRGRLKNVPHPSSHPIPLGGSLLELKERPLNYAKLTSRVLIDSPGQTDKLVVFDPGTELTVLSDPTADSSEVWVKFPNGESHRLDCRHLRSLTLEESAQHHREWLDAPGHYRHEVVKQIAPRHFVGTYIIEIPWNHTDGDLKAGFAAWLKKKESELGPPGCRQAFPRTGWDKPYARLKQLGALRLLRQPQMTVDAAIKHAISLTREILKNEKGEPRSLYGDNPRAWTRARDSADEKLQAFFGVS